MQTTWIPNSKLEVGMTIRPTNGSWRNRTAAEQDSTPLRTIAKISRDGSRLELVFTDGTTGRVPLTAKALVEAF